MSPALPARFGYRASFDRPGQKGTPLAWDLFIVREGNDRLAVVARAIRGYPTGRRPSTNDLPPRGPDAPSWDWLGHPDPLTYPLSAPIWGAFDAAAAANTVHAWDGFLARYPNDKLLAGPARAARARAATES